MADEQEELAEILEPLIEEALNLFNDWDTIDTGVMADNIATSLLEMGVVPPQGRTVTDVPTGGRL